MNFLFHELKGEKIAELPSGGMQIAGVEEALDLLGNAEYLGASMIIIYKEDLLDDFFDLSTGIAGDILQKFSNYRKRLAIIGDFSIINSKSLRDFIFESNKFGNILFVDSLSEALERLSSY